MKLVIGGRAQGKLALVLKRGAFRENDVCDGAICSLCAITDKPIFNHLHLFIRRSLEAGYPPRDLTAAIIRRNPQIIFLADEIGCGIVPLDPFERLWREESGRICCELAEQSESVERVSAGISTVIKGEKSCKSI